MKKEEALSKEFLKQFKTGEELFSFLTQIQKRGIEQILEGELDSHLGYAKSQVSEEKNARNGHSKKKIKNQFGEAEIKVPRDRDSSFQPMLVPKRSHMAEGVENIIISLYAKGMSVSDIEEQIQELYG